MPALKMNKNSKYSWLIAMIMVAGLILWSLAGSTKYSVRVIDGDTIAMGSQRVRLGCIDAPESDQPYGIAARKELEKVIGNRTVTISVESTDRYNRQIGWVILDGKDTANVIMVKRGYAWWYNYYCEDNDRLKDLQRFAQLHELGLWQGAKPINPYKWRKNNK